MRDFPGLVNWATVVKLDEKNLLLVKQRSAQSQKDSPKENSLGLWVQCDRVATPQKAQLL
jgi:hypothetical protein